MVLVDNAAYKLSVTRRLWGEVDGQPIWLYTLSRGKSMIMNVTNYGATVQSLFVQDRNKNLRDVVLGYDTLAEYINDPFYTGCVVGRFANRIDSGNVKVDGKTYRLTTTPGGYHHHGGRKGFNKQVWSAEPYVRIDAVGIKLTYVSPHLEEGFPGNLKVTVCYELNNYNEWKIFYEATTDEPTIINLTQHAYFNLSGEKNILKHELETNAKHILEANERQLPTGNLIDIEDSPFDFSTYKTIGKDIGRSFQLLISRGYDHYFVLEKERSNVLKYGGSLKEPSGLTMDFYTTEPGFHFYSGNYLTNGFKGKMGKKYYHRGGLCIETHNFPDAPNHPSFPSCILRPDQVFKSHTIFKFRNRA